MNAGYWTGDEWRWNVDKHDTPRITSVQVIEPAESEERLGKKVSFGFSLRDEEPEPSRESGEWIDWLDV